MAACSIVGLTRAFEKLTITCEPDPNANNNDMASSTDVQHHSSIHMTDEDGSDEPSEKDLAKSKIDVEVAENLLPNHSFRITFDYRSQHATLLDIKDLCFQPASLYKASRNKKPMIKKETDGTVSLVGVFFDLVVNAGQTCENFSFGRLKALRQWYSMCQSAAQQLPPSTWREDFLRAVTGDLAYKIDCSGTKKVPVRAPEFQEDVFETWSKYREHAYWKGSSGNDDVDDFDHLVTTMATGLRFFITEKGYIGVGNPHPGDEVWVLFGGDKPLLLRRDTASTSHWLVGDCFVHGIMDGEVLEDWRSKRQMVNLTATPRVSGKQNLPGRSVPAYLGWGTRKIMVG
jgi:hypothetical protein